MMTGGGGMVKPTVVFGSDHRGVAFKARLITVARSMGFETIDVGPNTSDSVDYPTYAHQLTEVMVDMEQVRGVLICGSGIGVCMAANRMPRIRAATCRTVEDAEMTRKHNDANVLCIGADVSVFDDAEAMMRSFLVTRFEGGRHQRRVDAIDRIDMGSTHDGDVVLG